MKRKKLTMIITVTAPANMPAAKIRKNVRSLIKHGVPWYSSCEDGDIIPIAVRPFSAEASNA